MPGRFTSRSQARFALCSSLPAYLECACRATPATHHLGPTGEPLYSERFDHVLPFHHGLAPVRRGKEAWHILEDGSRAYPQSYLRTFGFYEGRSAVVDRHGWHHILEDGQDLYPERYDAWRARRQIVWIESHP